MAKTASCSGYHDPIPDAGIGLLHAIVNSVSLKNRRIELESIKHGYYRPTAHISGAASALDKASGIGTTKSTEATVYSQKVPSTEDPDFGDCAQSRFPISGDSEISLPDSNHRILLPSGTVRSSGTSLPRK